jgi:uncharacterized protein (DUF1800 family)
MARLFSRAGFGATVSEIDQWVGQGYPAAVDHLMAFAPSSSRADEAARKAVLQATASEYDSEGRNQISRFQRWWLERMATTQYPLEEKLTLYWHGHFTSSYTKVQSHRVMIDQNAALRSNAAGSFRALCKDMTVDPAMLLFLDGAENRAGKPNENFGREFMELFTLGRNRGYVQRDVAEAARAFTGYSVTRNGAQFDPWSHDAAAKTILGNRGAWMPLDVTDLVLDRHPQGHVAARYVVRRLVTFLHGPNPEPALVEDLARRFVASDYQIGPVVRALLLRAEFADGTPRTIKSPAELVAGVMRALGIAGGDREVVGATTALSSGEDEFAAHAAAMGQALFDPPNVAGWKGGAAWANTATVLARYNFAVRAGQLVSADFVGKTLDEVNGVPQDTTATWMGRLGLFELSPAVRAGLGTYLDGARRAHDSAEAVARGILTLLIASPDYNLR